MSYTAINGMRSNRYPLQGVGATAVESRQYKGPMEWDQYKGPMEWDQYKGPMEYKGPVGLREQRGYMAERPVVRAQRWNWPGMFGLGATAVESMPMRAGVVAPTDFRRHGTVVAPTDFRRQRWRTPGMFGLEGCISCGAIDEATENGAENGKTEPLTGIQMGGVVLVMAGIAATLYIFGK